MSETPSENNGFEEPGSGKQGKIKKWQRVLLLLKFGIAKRSKFYILGNSHLKFNLLDQMKNGL